MNCWQCSGHAQAEETHVRAGCGQAGQAAAHFCARLNAFSRLTPLLCNSNEGSAFAHDQPFALRFEPPILHMGQGRAGARSYKTQTEYVLEIFLSSSLRLCYGESRQPDSRLNTRQARRTRSPARSPGQPLSRAGPATDLGRYRLMTIAWPLRLCKTVRSLSGSCVST
jgi:hypothetical protein